MTAARRLSAILAADVAGYSRLMGEDEVGTAKAVWERREAAAPSYGLSLCDSSMELALMMDGLLGGARTSALGRLRTSSGNAHSAGIDRGRVKTC